MPRKYGHAKILAAADKALGATLPPVLVGPPSFCPPGYVCRPENVTELLVPGHRRATAKDLAEYAKAWNAERREQEARPRPAPQPAEPTTSTSPAPRPERTETAEQYIERCLREVRPAVYPADTPTALYDERGEDKGVIPVWRPLRRADW